MQKQKKLIVLMVLVLGFIIFYSCEKVTLTDEPITVEDVLFSKDIKPIFNACIGCHNGSLKPNLQDNPYQSLKDGGYIDVAKPTQSKLYLELKTNSSHSTRVSPVQLQKILQWITQGGLNN